MTAREMPIIHVRDRPNLITDHVFEDTPFHISSYDHPEDAYGHAQMLLADLCDFCGVDDFDGVIRALRDADAFAGGDAFYEPKHPEATTISIFPLNGEETVMTIIRSFSGDGVSAIRFTGWLIANVMPDVRNQVEAFHAYGRADWQAEIIKLRGAQ